MTRIQKRSRFLASAARVFQWLVPIVAVGQIGALIYAAVVSVAGIDWTMLPANPFADVESLDAFTEFMNTEGQKFVVFWALYRVLAVLLNAAYLLALADVFRRLMLDWADGHLFTRLSAARLRTLGLLVGCYTILPKGAAEGWGLHIDIRWELIVAGLLITLVGWTFMEASQQREELEDVV